MGGLAQEELDDFDEHGFMRLPGFADAATCDAMLADVIEVTRTDNESDGVRAAMVFTTAPPARWSARRAW